VIGSGAAITGGVVFGGGLAVLGSTETTSPKRSATTMSGRPRPSSSAIAIDAGLSPAGNGARGAKPPAPSPARTDTVSASESAIARSLSPSASRSPIAIERGPSPVPNPLWRVNTPVPSPRKTDE
jgi:hypothetical protein